MTSSGSLALVVAAPLVEVLRSRNFRRLFTVRLSGQFCDGLFQSALATFVLFSPERQASAGQIAAAFAILYLPYSLVGPFVGVLLDRWKRRQVLLVGNLVRAAVVVVILAQTAAGHTGWDLAVAVLVALGINRFVLAALSAALPHTVPRSDLVTANALAPTVGTTFAAIGGIAGVAIRALLGGGDRGSVILLAVAVAGFAIAGLLALRMPRPLLGPDGTLASDTLLGIVVGLGSGAVELWRRHQAWRAVTAVTLHRVAFGAVTVVVILLLRNTINPSSAPDTALGQLTLALVGAAAGALLGALLTPAATRRWGTAPWSAATLAMAALVTPVAIATAEIPWLIVGALALGFAGQSTKVCADTRVQQLIADDHRGRVFALYDVFVNVGLVIGVAGAAYATPSSGQAPLVLVTVGFLLIATAGWLATHGRGGADSADGAGGVHRGLSA